MTRRPPARARASTVPARIDADAPENPSAEPTRDGRRRHPVERALDFRALERAGLTGAQIARRRRKSPGYVSVLLRLGRALDALDADERTALCSPRVTVGLIQRIVRVGVPDAEIRAQLRAAVSGVSRHNRDGRRGRRTRGQPPPQLFPGVTIASSLDDRRFPSTGSAGLAGWAWDQALWEADPEQYVRDLMARVEGLQRVVLGRARRAAREAAIGRLDAGRSLRGLAQQVLAARNAVTNADDPSSEAALAPETRRALEALSLWGHGLGAAAAGASRALRGTDVDPMSAAPRGHGSALPMTSQRRATEAVQVTAEEIEEELRD